MKKLVLLMALVSIACSAKAKSDGDGVGDSGDSGAASASPVKAAVDEQAQEDLMVTIYNNGYGLVREVRRVDLPIGTIELEYGGVAEKIDPTSVAFKSLTSPSDVLILEQNYRYDLLSPVSLLERFVGRTVKYTTYRMRNNSQVEETREGTLLSTNNGTVVQFGDEIVINPHGSVTLSEVPEDLLSRPTLVWLLENQVAGPQRVETAYLTNGMSWKADYVAVVNADDSELDVTGWVTLENHSGTGYKEAAVKLVAGDVQRVQEPRPPVLDRRLAMAAMAAPQFQEKAFFEYHLYTLQRRATVANNETKQMTLLEAADVPIKKLYIMDSPRWSAQAGAAGVAKSKLGVFLEFENSEEAGMGMALPKGRVRVYKADTDESLQLIGEDRIDHTPRDEKLRLKMGEAFDVVAERSQTNFRKIGQRSSETSFKVVIRNHKDEAIEATVMEHLYGDWAITQQSHPHRKIDATTIEFKIPVPADGEAELTYTARVNW